VPPPHTPSRFAVVMCVAGSEDEAARFRDTFASLIHHEPHTALVVIVDDCARARPLAAEAIDALPAGTTTRIVQRQHPLAGRNARPEPAFVGPHILAGMSAAFSAVVDNNLNRRGPSTAPGLDFVLKLDTDALVLQPFAVERGPTRSAADEEADSADRDGAVTTMNIDGGTVYYESTGTLTTGNVGGGGVLDFRRNMGARTVTNCSLYENGSLFDPQKTVAWSNGIDITRASIPEVTIDIGSHFTLTPSTI